MKKTICIILIIIPCTLASTGQWWSLYFSTPGTRHGAARCPEKALIRLIGSARQSINGAFYDISSPAVAGALIQAGKRGVSIRLVTEKDNYNHRQVTLLLRSGIPVVPDRGRGLMHHKFAVIDSQILWTGSYNITANGSRKNNNNAIEIRSPELCSIYLLEFEEMFTHGIFGNRSERGPFGNIAKKYHVDVNGTDINAYFSPEDNIERIILKRLKKAQNSIYFMAFTFTSDALSEMMIRKFKEGVAVHGLFEKRGSGSRYSEYVKMKIEGIPVHTDRNRFTMHHKVIIIDKKLVITGSYNFTKGASVKNDENILIIQNTAIAGLFLEEFNRLY